MRSWIFLAVVAIAGTWAIVRHIPHGEAQVAAVVAKAEPRVQSQAVQSVSIDTPNATAMDRRLPLADLRRLLTTKPGELVDAYKLETDRRALEEALAARGYLAAKVAPATVTFDDAGAYVVFDVERGPMFRLRNVTVTGPGERHIGVVTLSPGDDAVKSRLDRARQTLQELLAARASRSTVELRLHADHATASVDVELATTEVTVLR